MKNNIKLFLTMFKIGLFTFGGGYAMIPLLENEFVNKKAWLQHEEFVDMLAISESSPGPIAINMATFIGYRQGKFWGSLMSTLGVVMPSFIIISLISLAFRHFLEIPLVSAAFKGIQACVVFLIFMAGWKMFKKMKKNVFNCVVCSLTMALVIAFSLFSLKFSTIYYILIGGTLSLAICLIKTRKPKTAKEGEK